MSQRLWKCRVLYTTPGGERLALTGVQVYWAETAEDAKECILGACWDPRLEAGGCTSDVEVSPLERRVRCSSHG